MVDGIEIRLPDIPPDVVEAARAEGGGWCYEVVGDHDPAGPVPGHAIRGAWRLNAEGRVTEYVANPRYQRSAGGGCPVHRPGGSGSPHHHHHR